MRGILRDGLVSDGNIVTWAGTECSPFGPISTWPTDLIGNDPSWRIALTMSGILGYGLMSDRAAGLAFVSFGGSHASTSGHSHSSIRASISS